MTIHLKKALQYVELNGSGFQRNYFRSLFGEKNLEETLEKLAQFQNTDGGWIGLDTDYTGTVSSITCTMTGLGKLERLHVDFGRLIDSTIAYLKRVQKARGMWDEPADILDFYPPSWYYPKVTKNQVWFTNGILRYVISRKPQEHEMIAKARGYLRTFWDGKSFPGYAHNNWMGIVSFHDGDELMDKDIRQGCLENVRRDIHGYDLADVIWALESCSFLKISQTDPVITDGLELIMAGQGEDGGFGTEYGEAHRVDVTIDALDTLAHYGVISRCLEFPTLHSG